MKIKLLVSLCVAAGLAVAMALAQDNKSAATDPRVDKLLEQHEQILKNQQDILKNQQEILQKLDKIDQGLLQVRRRGT